MSIDTINQIKSKSYFEDSFFKNRTRDHEIFHGIARRDLHEFIYYRPKESIARENRTINTTKFVR